MNRDTPDLRERPICAHDSMIGSAPERCAQCEAEKAFAERQLTLRDRFAMAALTGIMAAAPHYDMLADSDVALAYRRADAMLEARATKQQMDGGSTE